MVVEGSQIDRNTSDISIFAHAANTLDDIEAVLPTLREKPLRVVCLVAIDNDNNFTLLDSGEVGELLALLSHVALLTLEASHED